MDREEEKSAEAQTSKVAETVPTNGGDTSADAAMNDAPQGDASTKAEAAEKDAPINTKSASSTAPRRSPTSRSPEQTKRPSSRSPSPSTKRQRTSLSPSTSRDGPYRHPSRHSPPPRESRSPRAKPDDKARTRRLFGGMLNTIAAKPSSRRAPYEAPRRVDPAKREELERKAAEREKIRLKEEEDARRERELRKREENKDKHLRWERDTIIARAENESMKAEYLRTNAKPELYYKPYILTDDQKDTIERQIEDAELSIQKEIRQYEETHPDQDPLPWKLLATKDYIHGDDTPQDQKEDKLDEEDTAQVSPPPADSSKVAKEEPVSRMDGTEETQQEQKKERIRTDDFDEEVIDTEGGESLIY